MSSVAPCADSTRSRMVKLAVCLATARNARLTTRSIDRVSQLVVGRGTITVTMTLRAEVRTISAPAMAARMRAKCGTATANVDTGANVDLA
jgi:hypothetical protein